MTETLPAPPIPAEVDLRTFDDMPLDVRALRDSDTAAEVTDEAFRAAVMLWCSAWHQIPAASLPNDDQKLARLAGYGRDTRGWKRVREQALRGFQLCSDGRLYHLYMCAKAKKAFAKKNEQKVKANERWKDAKSRKTKKTGNATASAAADTAAQPGQSHGTSRGNSPAMPLNRGDLSPPISPPEQTAGSDRVPSDPSARPSTTTPAAEPEFVIVQIESGAKLKIDRHGNCDEVWAPRDCPPTSMTRAEYLELRRNALAQPAEHIARSA